MTPNEVIEMYERYGALWFFNYEGDPKAPHAELPRSGMCSDGYVNSARVTSHPDALQFLVFAVAKRLRQRGIHPEWVVGSAMGAITFSYELARQMDACHGHTEKDPDDPKRMLWRRFQIDEGATVLDAEELVTTFGTAFAVREAIQRENPAPVNILPVVATIIYRPPQLGVDTPLDIISLVEREVKRWRRDGCPLCRQGSRPLRPKRHWAELTKER